MTPQQRIAYRERCREYERRYRERWKASLAAA
jgi:hypothetical protein